MTGEPSAVLQESTWNEDAKEWRHSCGTIVTGAVVYHPVHDGLSGGQVRMEVVPYCPTCQEQPSEHGALRSAQVLASRMTFFGSYAALAPQGET